MQLYLLSSDPLALQICREAAEDARIVVRDASDASAIPTSSTHGESTVVITDSGHFLAHVDDMARLSAGGQVRGAVLCADPAAAEAVASRGADGWEAIAVPTASIVRLRLSDWAAVETLRLESAAHVRQAHDAATAAERASQEVTALRQKMAFLDGQRERLSAVMETQGLLSRLSQEINCLDLDEIITVCVTKVPLLVNARYASFYMYNLDAGTLELKRHNHGYRIDDVVRVAEGSRSVMCRALLERRIILVRDFEEYERLNDVSVERPNAKRYGSKSAIIAPMLAGDRAVAVLNLADKRSGATFDEASDLPPIEQMSVLVGQAVRNWQLFQEVRLRAKSDAMTGFINHQTFFDELEKEVLRVRRYHGALSVLMIDVDCFKQINDRHGHQIGDAILP